jgi:hypothetical protein
VIEQVIFFLAPARARSGSLYSCARIWRIWQHQSELLAQLQQIQALGKVCRVFKRCLLKLPFDVRVMFRFEVPVVDTIVFKFDIHDDILSLFFWIEKIKTLHVTSAPKSELVGQVLASIVYEEDRRVFLDIIDIPVPAFSNFRSLPPCDSVELAQGNLTDVLVCLHVSLKTGKLLYFVSAETTWSKWSTHRAFARSAEFDLCSLNKLIAEGPVNSIPNPSWLVLLLVPIEYVVKMKASGYLVTDEARFGGSYKCDLTGRSEFPDIEPIVRSRAQYSC